MTIRQLFVTELPFGHSTDFFQIRVAKLNGNANGTWAIQNAPPLNLPFSDVTRNFLVGCTNHCIIYYTWTDRWYFIWYRLNWDKQQECIPIGCVLYATVAVSPATHAFPHLPRMPPSHACLLPHTHPATHTLCHACLPATHPLPCKHPPPPHMPLLPCMPPPPVNRITDRCKNITFTQLLIKQYNEKWSRWSNI